MSWNLEDVVVVRSLGALDLDVDKKPPFTCDSVATFADRHSICIYRSYVTLPCYLRTKSKFLNFVQSESSLVSIVSHMHDILSCSQVSPAKEATTMAPVYHPTPTSYHYESPLSQRR